MGWRTVVITQNAKLSLSMNNLVAQTRDGVEHIPLDDIQVLLLETTQAVVTSALLAEMAGRQIDVIYTSRNGQPVGACRSLTPNNRTAELLRKQLAWPDNLVENVWTKIIFAKINSQQQVLNFLGMDTGTLAAELDKLQLNDVTNREAVAAHYYFPVAFGDGFVRSNSDAVNGALNYGYAILLSLVNCFIITNGYLTQFGIHHHSTQNSYNLGSDLMEPFRPVYDQWVSKQQLKDITPDVKYRLVEVLDTEITFNGRKEIMRNAVERHVANCLHYLSGETDELRIEVTLPNEVSYRAINDHV